MKPKKAACGESFNNSRFSSRQELDFFMGNVVFLKNVACYCVCNLQIGPTGVSNFLEKGKTCYLV